jgi:ketosteroid isomerase-like protein
MEKLTILTAVLFVLAGCAPRADTKEVDEVGKQNMELVMKMLQAYENEDIETIKEVYSPDVTSDGPSVGEGVGLEEMLESNKEMFEGVDSIRIKVRAMLPYTVDAEADEDLAGDWVFFWADIGWHVVEAGKTVWTRWHSPVKIKDGQIVYEVTYMNQWDLFNQLGAEIKWPDKDKKKAEDKPAE